MNITIDQANSHALNTHISDTIIRLAAPRERIEIEFFQMGEKLISGTHLLNETSSAYSQMAGALAGSQFTDLTNLLKQLSEHIVIVDQARHAAQNFLIDLNSLTDQFTDCIQHLNTTVRTLRSFFVTARVTAAVSRNREINLIQFTDQFSQLGTQLDGNVSSFIDAFKSMRSSLGAATDMNEKLGAQHIELLDGIAAEQTDNLKSLESRRVWAESRIAIHDEESNKIREKINRAVGTLQVGDSTRQRVEHVEDALKALIGVEDRTSLKIALTLAAAQIQGAIEDFDGDIAELVKSVEKLIENTKTLLLRADADSEMLLSSGDTALGVIDNSLDRTARMLEQYERGNAARSVAIDQLVNAVSNMLAHIGDFDEIRKSIRLLSLNSTLKAKALNDEGRAFQQVAADLRALSDETNGPVDEMVQNLEKSSELLRDFLVSRPTGKGDLIECMQTTVRTASQLVSDIGSQLRLQANCMSKSGPEALSQLNIAASTVRDRQDFCAEWRSIVTELSTATTREELQDFISTKGYDFFRPFYEKYTMKAERTIYNDVFGLIPEQGNQAITESEHSEGPELDDIFF